MSLQSVRDVIERLKQGNERFVKDRAEPPRHDSARREELAKGQRPYAVILTCADSRVAPEIAFDAGLGELFVVRVAGNIANRSSMASIEYAVAHLGSRVIVVMGHESCGAVAAALEGGEAGRNLNHLLEHLQPALDASGSHEVDAVARRNALMTVERLSRESDIIREAVEKDGVRIVPAFYSIRSGRVEMV
jgi:carbonic anhydrase